jgi:RND family efflux transporter MFP subunit
VLFLASACTSASGQATRGGRGQAVPVQTATVQRISIQRSVDLSGTLISPDQAKVSSEVAGVVQDVDVVLGQEVRQGQVLVHIAPRELELALQRAESALKQTEAQLGIEDEEDRHLPPDDQVAAVRTAVAGRDDARAQANRAESLATQGLISTADLEAARTHLKVADAAYEAAIETVHSLKASLEDRRATYVLAQKKLNDASIKAPVPGSVSERLVQPGEFIKEDTPVITLVQVDPLKLSTAVQEKYAGVIRPGMQVEFTVESFPNETFRGRIVSVSPAVDMQTRTFPIEAEVPNQDRRLKPGFFAKGAILTKVDDNVIAVPENAVSTLAGVSTVFVIENGQVKPQEVAVGAHQNRETEIVDGLKGDERLATTNLNQLAAGVSVTGPGTGGTDAAGGGRGQGRQGGRRAQ